MSLAARSALVAALFACLAVGAVEAMVLNQLGPAAGLGLPIGAATAVLVFQRPILGVQLALLAIPLEFFSVKLGGDAGLSLTEMLLLLTAGAALVGWAVQGDRPAVPPVLQPFLLLCVVVGAGLAVAGDQAVVFKVLAMWSAFAVIAVLTAGAEAADLVRAITCLAVAGGVAGWIAVAGGTDQALIAGGTIATNRAQASFSQPNVLGFFLTMAIPAAVVLGVRKRGLVRVAMGVLAAGAIWGLVLSLSRTSLLGTGMALLVLLLLPEFRRMAGVALSVLAILALLNVQALQESQQISVVTQRLATLGPGETGPSNPRLDIYRTVPSMVAADPLLGVGAGNFPLEAKRYALLDYDGMPYDHAHNVPLTVAAELGLIGLAALAWLALQLAVLVRRAIRLRRDPATGPLLLAASAGVVGTLIPSLGDYPPRTNAILATFLVLVGVLAGLTRSAAQAAASSEP